MTRAEYKRKWREKNKEKLKVYFKEYKQQHLAEITANNQGYYSANKEKISEQRKTRYKNDNKMRQAARRRAEKQYKTDKNKHMAKNRSRFTAGRDKIAKIALHYGCQNPTCKWKGGFFPVQLHFHHKDGNTKLYNVSSMGGRKPEVIAAEINKCCVLCACCHAAVTRGLILIESTIGCAVSDCLGWQ